jgi:hypothetical protein
MRRGLPVLIVAALLALPACSADMPEPGPDSATSSRVASPSEVESESPAVPADQQFTLDDQAEFDDGLLVEIAGSLGQQAAKGVQGAEATGGQVVVASVRIENNTHQPYEPADVEVTATYGNGTRAKPVVDPGHAVVSDFEGVIAIGDEGVAAVAFAVPAAERKKVTFTIDLHDDSHDPVSFTGQVATES